MAGLLLRWSQDQAARFQAHPPANHNIGSIDQALFMATLRLILLSMLSFFKVLSMSEILNCFIRCDGLNNEFSHVPCGWKVSHKI